MKVFFLIGAVAALDCSNDVYFSHTPNSGGTRVIYDGTLWQAQWSANLTPGKDLAWTKLGACDPLPPTPSCWPAYSDSAVYASPNTQVSDGGWNYINQWYANPGAGPAVDRENWLTCSPCAGGNGGITPTTTPTTTTTTTTASTTTTTTPRVVPTTAPTVAPVVPTEAPVVPTEAPTVPTNPPTVPTNPPTVPTNPPIVPTNPPIGGGNERPAGPTGPNGECVWPAWDSTKAYGNSFTYYVTHKGGVYQKSYYCDPGREPGVDGCWAPQVATCTGEPPVLKLTAAELGAMVDPNGPKYQMFLDKWDPTSPTDAELAAAESGIISGLSEAAKRVIGALEVLDADSVEAITPGSASNPENVKRVERLVTLEKWNQLFPVRHPSYTYENLLKAVGAFPAYCQTYSDGRNSDEICVKLLITSFAHNTQEVGANIPSLTYTDGNHMLEGGIHYHPESNAYFCAYEPIELWQQAFWFVREVGWTEDSTAESGYRRCAPDSADSMMWALNYQCPAGADYFGRGAKQLSWNYNYGMFSKLFFKDASYLLSNPALVADTWLNIASGIWFSVTPQSPKPSMLEVLDGSWVPNSVDTANGISAGFGATINIINGGLECGMGTISPQAQNRINAYKNFAAFFGVSIPASEQLDCATQKPFAAGGAGDMMMYWGNSWSSPFTCQLIGYQSAFLAGVPGDYENCVNYWFRARWVDKDSKQVIAQYGNVGSNAAPPV